MIERPVSRLRWVADSITGAPVDTARERAECELDSEGRTVRWRLWLVGPKGWRPEPWRAPSSRPLAKRRGAIGGGDR